AEFVLVYQEAFTALGLKDFTVKINNRKILSGIAEVVGKPELIVDMTVAIDKLDKIGLEGVHKVLMDRGFMEEDLDILKDIILMVRFDVEKLGVLRYVLGDFSVGLQGIEEV